MKSHATKESLAGTCQAIDAIFHARSVAVVGASADPAKFGCMTLASILEGGFDGAVYPVNPKASELMGLRTYPSLSAIPGPVDLAVIVVPARFVPDLLREAAAKGAKGAMVNSGGFREAGRTDLEEAVRQAVDETGLRLIGPNVQGINYLPNRLCAMFFPVITCRGPLAVISQSGTVTAVLSEWAEREGFGISAAVNLGNQVDLCDADYLDYFAGDPDTRVIVMYLEGVKDGRRFLDALGRATAVKPVVVLKGGRTAAGIRSASSHTGALAGSHKVFAAACRQQGAVVAPDLETLYDQAKGLAALPAPKGGRVIVVTTSGGAGTLAVDEVETVGLNAVPLPPALAAEMKEAGFSPLAHFANPLDLASITAADFDKAVRLIDRHDAADVILISYGDPVKGGVEVVRTLARDVRAGLAVSYMGGGQEEISGREALAREGFPVFPAPERAVRGIRAALDYAMFRAAGDGKEAAS